MLAKHGLGELAVERNDLNGEHLFHLPARAVQVPGILAGDRRGFQRRPSRSEPSRMRRVIFRAASWPCVDYVERSLRPLGGIATSRAELRNRARTSSVSSSGSPCSITRCPSARMGSQSISAAHGATLVQFRGLEHILGHFPAGLHSTGGSRHSSSTHPSSLHLLYLSMHSFFHFGRRPAASKTCAAAASCPSASRISAASRGSAPQLCTGVRGWFWIQQLMEFQQAPSSLGHGGRRVRVGRGEHVRVSHGERRESTNSQ